MPQQARIFNRTATLMIALLIITFTLLLSNFVAHAQERQVVLNCSTGEHITKSGQFDCANATGGSSSYAITTVPSTLNPVTTLDSASSAIHDHIFGTVFSEYSFLGSGPDGLTPQAASQISLNADGNEITFTLRDDLSFSDGSAVMADDVLYWFYDVVGNPDLPNSHASRFICSGTGEPFLVTAPDSRTVNVSCPAPFGAFSKLAASLFVMSRDMALDLINDQNISTEPGRIGPRATREFLGLDADLNLIRGLGPFVLTQLDPQASAMFERNNFFYQFDSRNTRLPYLDNLEIVILPDGGRDAVFSSFIGGRIDAMIPRSSDISSIFGASFGGGFRVNFDINNGSAQRGLEFITLNFDDTNPGLAEVARSARVRQALSLAVDRVQIVNNVHFGIGVPQYLPLDLNGPTADSFFIGRDNSCASFSSTGFSCDENRGFVIANSVQVQTRLLPPPSLSNEMRDLLGCISNFSGCISQANALLDGERLSDSNGNGTRNLPNGSEWQIEIQVPAGGQVRGAYANIICDGWGQLGIDCNVREISFGLIVTQLLGLGGASWSGAIALGFTGNPLNSQLVYQCGGALQFWHMRCDPNSNSGPNARVGALADLEEAYVNGLNASSFAETQENFDEFQRIWTQTQPFILIAVANELYAVRTDRICNDGRMLTANDELKFRVDNSANSSACTTNQGR